MTQIQENEILLNSFVDKLKQEKENNPFGLSKRDKLLFRSVMGLVTCVSLYLVASQVTIFSRLSVLETKENTRLERYLTRVEYEKDRVLFLPVKSYIQIETERALDVSNMLLDLSLILKIREEDIKRIQATTQRNLNKSLLFSTYTIPSLQ